MVFREKTTFPEEALHLLEQFAGKVNSPNELRFLPEPKTKPNYYAVEMNNKDIWMLNMDSGQAMEISKGNLLKWSNDGNIHLGKTKSDEPFYFIGLDTK